MESITVDTLGQNKRTSSADWDEMRLNKLFEENWIGAMRLRNRIVMTALHLDYADETGFITDQFIDFYTERAKGGVGLITVGICYTEPLGRVFKRQPGVDRDELIPRLNKLTSSVHRHGAKICCQIGHGGRRCEPDVCGDQPVCPSPVSQSVLIKDTVPKELSIAEITKIVENFGCAATRVKKAGFDAVELAASGGALISQFLSPLTNKRTDRYGGDLKNRMSFLLDIIAEVKSKVGNDYPVLCRVCGQDMMPGGHTLADQIAVAKTIEEAGIDCINVNVGWEESPYPMLQMMVPPGSFAFLAKEIKGVVQVPVIGGIGINDPHLAERLIRDGIVDLVTMARPLIADPELPQKAREGRFDEIRTCVHCNQRCLDSINASERGVTCLVNVRAGKESEWQIKPASKRKQVFVIGGGPAGAEAARVSRLRGHDVYLYERTARLGGTVNIAAISPGKGEMNRISEYYSSILPKIGVKVYLDTEVTLRLIETNHPDVVVVATGASPSAPQFQIDMNSKVVKAEEVLRGQIDTGTNVVILGGGGTGCETALFLAHKGTIRPDSAVFLASAGILLAEEAIALTRKGNKSITILEMLPKFARDVGRSARFVLVQELKRRGVEMIVDAKVEKVTPEGVFYVKNGHRSLIRADTVVIALGYKSNTEIYNEIKDTVPEIYLIGDAKQPRRAAEAIEEGFLAGLKI